MHTRLCVHMYRYTSNLNKKRTTSSLPCRVCLFCSYLGIFSSLATNFMFSVFKLYFSFRMRQYKQAELHYSINLADSFQFMFLYS